VVTNLFSPVLRQYHILSTYLFLTDCIISAHCIIALDANFAQKCLKGRYEDLPLVHPATQFIPDTVVQEMAARIESLKKKPSKVSGVGLCLPEEVLKDCEVSSTTAHTSEAKASTVIYVDTGLVALVCRHDRVLWVVNMDTPGERQHYAFTLLERLFLNIPSEWHIGVLYDIACQIERSMLKVYMTSISCNRAITHFHYRLDG